EVNGWLEAALERRDFLGGLSRLRLFQQRELLRVGARDLARLSDAVETTFELSNLADVCLTAVLEICAQQLSERLGRPYHKDARDQWTRTQLQFRCRCGLRLFGGRPCVQSSAAQEQQDRESFDEPPIFQAACRGRRG